jgi:hypothetical protein
MAAERYLQTGKPERARSLLIEMDSDKLTDEAYVKHTDLLAGIALDEGSVLEAGDAMQPAGDVLRGLRVRQQPICALDEVLALAGEAAHELLSRLAEHRLRIGGRRRGGRLAWWQMLFDHRVHGFVTAENCQFRYRRATGISPRAVTAAVHAGFPMCAPGTGAHC